ncbi:MAG: hypothetical protein AAFX99_11530 [Myxococcota bacterium]
MTLPLIIITSIAVVVVIVLCVVAAQTATGKLLQAPDHFADVMDALGALPNPKNMRHFTYERGGVPYHFAYTVDGEGADHFILSRPLPSFERHQRAHPERPPLDVLPTINFHREGWDDRLGKKLHLNREVQTQDPAFDDTVYIESDTVSHEVELITASKALRDAILHLLTSGFQSVHLRLLDAPLAARMELKSPHHNVDAKRLSEAMDMLDTIAEAMPPVRLVPNTPQPFQGSLLVAGTFLFAFVSLLGFIIALLNFPEFHSTLSHLVLQGTALILTVTLVGSWLALRGRPTGMKFFAIIAFTMLAAAPMSTYAGVQMFNALGDPTVETIERPILGMRVDEGSEGDSYHLTFQSWPPLTEPEVEIKVSWKLFKGAQEGKRYRITFGHGRLHSPWLKSIGPADETP